MGRTSNREKEEKKRATTYLDMIMALRVKTGLSEQTIRKVYMALVEYIIEELKIGNIVRLRYLGNYVIKNVGGYSKKMPDVKSGQMIEKFIEPNVKIKFLVAESFSETIKEPLGYSKKKGKGELIEAGSILKEQKNVLVRNLLKKESLKVSKTTNSSEEDKIVDLTIDEELLALEEDMEDFLGGEESYNE